MPETDGTQLVLWLAERHRTAEIIVATGLNATERPCHATFRSGSNCELPRHNRQGK